MNQRPCLSSPCLPPDRFRCHLEKMNLLGRSVTNTNNAILVRKWNTWWKSNHSSGCQQTASNLKSPKSRKLSISGRKFCRKLFGCVETSLQGTLFTPKKEPIRETGSWTEVSHISPRTGGHAADTLISSHETCTHVPREGVFPHDTQKFRETRVPLIRWSTRNKIALGRPKVWDYGTTILWPWCSKAGKLQCTQILNNFHHTNKGNYFRRTAHDKSTIACQCGAIVNLFKWIQMASAMEKWKLWQLWDRKEHELFLRRVSYSCENNSKQVGNGVTSFWFGHLSHRPGSSFFSEWSRQNITIHFPSTRPIKCFHIWASRAFFLVHIFGFVWLALPIKCDRPANARHWLILTATTMTLCPKSQFPVPLQKMGQVSELHFLSFVRRPNAITVRFLDRTLLPCSCTDVFVTAHVCLSNTLTPRSTLVLSELPGPGGADDDHHGGRGRRWRRAHRAADGARLVVLPVPAAPTLRARLPHVHRRSVGTHRVLQKQADL